MSDSSHMRLNKYLALNSGLSRRQADDLIERGHVTVNGTVAKLGAQIGPDDVVQIKEQVVAHDTALVYLALHKPVGYVCSRKKQGDNPTIYELIPNEYRALKPVGRLDRDSSGLLLLTNDGDFAHQMTHPSHYKVKRYEVNIDRALEPLHQQMINDFGVELPDGKSQLTLERVTDDRRRWIITMTEGRNRQIRRTFAALGYTVVALHRTDFGPYHLGNLASGKFQPVGRL